MGEVLQGLVLVIVQFFLERRSIEFRILGRAIVVEVHGVAVLWGSHGIAESGEIFFIPSLVIHIAVVPVMIPHNSFMGSFRALRSEPVRNVILDSIERSASNCLRDREIVLQDRHHFARAARGLRRGSSTRRSATASQESSDLRQNIPASRASLTRAELTVQGLSQHHRPQGLSLQWLALHISTQLFSWLWKSQQVIDRRVHIDRLHGEFVVLAGERSFRVVNEQRDSGGFLEESPFLPITRPE